MQYPGKDLVDHIVNLQNSLSYKVGFALTLPFRWFLEKVIRRNRSWQAYPPMPQHLVEQNGEYRYTGPSLTTERIVTQVETVTEIQKEIVDRPIPVRKIYPLKKAIAIDQAIVARRPEKFNVLFISPHLPDYDTSSGGKRATRMLQLLASKFNVYVYTLGDREEKYKAKLNEIGVTVLDSPHLSEINIDTHQYPEITDQLDTVHTIIYAWYTTWYQSKHIKNLYPQAKVVFDSVDIHWIREARLVGEVEGFTEEDVEINKNNEVAAYDKGDFVWVVTENDAVSLKDELPTAEVKIVSNIHDIDHPGWNKCEKNSILFMGGYKHTPNLAAAHRLAKNIFPLIKEQIPDAELNIAGSHAPEDIQALGELDEVNYLGFIDEAELPNLYENTFCTVVALNAGAGIKGKICEAIAHGVVVVTNSIGNEGIALDHGTSGFCGESDAELATACIEAMKRDYDVNVLVTKSQTKLMSLVGPDFVKKQMIETITPLVVVCIVTWNRHALVKRCIESVLKNTRYPNYKIVVWSNGCTDGTQEYLNEISVTDSRIEPVLSKKNEIFVIPNNKMMMMYPDSDVVLLNNDTYVTENWLLELHHAAYERKDIGISGSKIIYPDGKLQEFGSELYNNFSGNNIGKNQDPHGLDFQSIKRIGYVSGCSFYVKRKTINKIGVFDMKFHPCYCEDSDMCYTAWEHGLETVVTPHSIIYHDEGGTSGTSTSSGFKSYQEINFLKFFLKHRGKLNGINWYLDLDISKILSSAKTNYKDQFGQMLLNGTQPGNAYYQKVQWIEVNGRADYRRKYAQHVDVFRKRRYVENLLFRGYAKDFEISGIDPISKKDTQFYVGHERPSISDGIPIPDMPRTFIDAKYGLNGIQRSLLIWLKKQQNVTRILSTQNADSIDQAINEHFDVKLSQINIIENTIEDNAQYDIIMSIDNLHLHHDYQSVLKQYYTGLNADGKLIMTTHSSTELLKNQVHATRSLDGSIKKFDGFKSIDNPFGQNKSYPIFTTFGWELLDDLRNIGFKEAKIINIWSMKYGLLGKDLFLIEAIK